MQVNSGHQQDCASQSTQPGSHAGEELCAQVRRLEEDNRRLLQALERLKSAHRSDECDLATPNGRERDNSPLELQTVILFSPHTAQWLLTTGYMSAYNPR